MVVNLPNKKYLTFEEVAQKLECNIDDVLHFIVNRLIVPSVYIDRGNYERHIFYQDYDEATDLVGLLVCLDCDFENIDAYESKAGFHYLICPTQNSPNYCFFNFFDDKARGHKEGDRCFRLEEALGLDFLKKYAVVMSDEFAYFVNSSIDTNVIAGKQTTFQDDPADLPDELSTANIAYRAVKNGYGDQSATFKNRLLEYLKTNYSTLKPQAIERIATVANPDKTTGRKNTSNE